MKVVITDGGRVTAGFKGKGRDCVTRAVAIATEQPYMTVYEALSEGCRTQRKTKNSKIAENAMDGVITKRKWFTDYMTSLGWRWTPTMFVGQGCKTHLTDGELPMGRLIVNVSRHYTAVIDGVIYDNHDPQRGGKRCVYGYWSKL